MRGRKGILVGIVMVCLLLLTGCEDPITFFLGEKEAVDSNTVPDPGSVVIEEGMRQTVLYYQSQEGIVIPVTKTIPWEEGIAKAALSHLIDVPTLRDSLASAGLVPVFPEGTVVLGMAIQDGLCKVDFSKEILNLRSESEERAMVQSLVYTLTEFDTIDQVQILVEGEILDKLPFGTDIGSPLKREAINLSAALPGETLPVTVYYKTTANGIDSFYVPVTKGIQALNADIKSALVALLEGAPEGTNLYSEIPQGVTVSDVYVKDGVAYIDLSEEVKKIPANRSLQQSMVYELGLTLQEIEPTIAQVRILSGGSEIELLPDVQLNLPTHFNVQ